MIVDLSDVREIADRFRGKKGVLIPLLQAVQARFSYVPEEAIPTIAEAAGVFPVEVYGVITFYAQFYLAPRGRHIVRVCMGTACYIMGGKDLLDHLQEKLGVAVDGTTPDGLFTLGTVACLGCCGRGPVLTIAEKFLGRGTVRNVDEEIDRLAEAAKSPAEEAGQ